MVDAPHSFSPHGVSLRDVLECAQFLACDDIQATSCCSDSRRVQPGDLFVALPGVECDGHDFVEQALERGARALLLERPLPIGGVPSCIVEDVREAYGITCQALAGNPSRRLRVVGVTGTNGKTTTTALTAGVLRAAGACVGTIGTLGICDGYELAAATHTTPPAAVTAHWLLNMVANDCSHAVMEVSSHALSQCRVAGIDFDAAIFTNIRRDHLDYHGSIQNYHRVKARLLDLLTPQGTAIINVDDPECAALLSKVTGPVITYGLSDHAQVTAVPVERHRSEQTFLLSVGSETAVVCTPLIGDHNIHNCLAAAALGFVSGLDLTQIVRGLESVPNVPGRMERIECGQPFSVYVDYAHTPDALEAALAATRQVTEGRVICVFGAGGDRDPRKRPLMGAAVERAADLVVLTSDNPRYEEPVAIARDIRQGFDRPSRVQQLLDREAAINFALGEARPGDSVLIAGKGHEGYQVIGSQKFYFDDREVARDFLYRLAPQTMPSWAQS